LLHEPIEDVSKLLERHVVVVSILHDANRALEVAVVGDLDDRQTRMLLVIRAKATIIRAALLDLRRVLERDRSFLDVRERLQEPIGVARDERFALPMRGALLSQIHFAVADDARSIHWTLAGWAKPF